MNWDQLRVLLAIHREGSLRGAADSLGVNHATVARALQGAESHLGTRLFDRSQKGLRPTQSGELILPHALEMEKQIIEVERRLTGLDAKPSGTVRVSIPPSFAQGLFMEFLADFTQAYSQIMIDVVATNRFSDLNRLEADVSVRFAESVEDDVVGRRLLTYVIAAFASPAYIEEHPDIAEKQGEGTHWIGWGSDDEWVAKSPLPKASVRHRLPEVFMQAEAAANGIGMAWIPAVLGDKRSDIFRVPNVEARPDRSIWILLHGDLRETARVRAFVDFFSAWTLKRRNQFVM
ncbi:MAG: LysR family transcriptional regulator [Pseudomonadota bacterium]